MSNKGFKSVWRQTPPPLPSLNRVKIIKVVIMLVVVIYEDGSGNGSIMIVVIVT